MLVAGRSAAREPAVSPGPPPRRRCRARWPLVLGALGLGLVVLLVKLPELLLPIGPDQGTYSYVAQRILAGALPYRDAWDNKPPGTYYLHALAVGLVPAGLRWNATCIAGLPQACGYLALQATDVVWTTITAWVVALVGWRLSGRARVGLLAGVLFGAFASIVYFSREGSTPEKELLLPLVAAYGAALYGRSRGSLRWFALAGLLGGIAFLFKQVAASMGLALAAWLIWDAAPLARRAPRRALRAVALPLLIAGVAALVPLSLVSLAFARQGAFGDFWSAAFAYNVAQAGTHPRQIPRTLVSHTWQAFTGGGGLLWLLALAGLLASPRLVRVRSEARLLLCWAVADSLTLLLGGAKFTPVYYDQLLPSYSILAAIGAAWLWSSLAGLPARRGYLLAALAVVLALTMRFQLSQIERALNERIPPRAISPPWWDEAPTMRSLVGGGPFYVWGDASEVYLYVGAASPSRYFHVFPVSQVAVAGNGYLARRDQLMRDLQAHPPTAILLDPSAASQDPTGALGMNPTSFPAFEAFLQGRYHLVSVFGPGAPWRLYARDLE